MGQISNQVPSPLDPIYACNFAPVSSESSSKQNTSRLQRIAFLPIKAAAISCNVLAKVTPGKAMVPLYAAGWAGAKAANQLFKGLSWTLKVAKDGETANQALLQGYQVKQLENQVIDTSILAEIAGVEASVERQFEKRVSWWGTRYLKLALETLRYSTPLALQVLHTSAKQAESTTNRLSNALFRGMKSPEMINDTLTNVADRLEAVEWKATHQTTQVGPYFDTDETLRNGVVETKEAISKERILSLVGPQVVSDGMMYASVIGMLDTSAHSIKECGIVPKEILKLIGKSGLPAKLESILNISAGTLELLMALPYGKEFLSKLLNQSAKGLASSNTAQALDALDALQEQIHKLSSTSSKGQVITTSDPQTECQVSQLVRSVLDTLPKQDPLALFLRRSFKESLMIDKTMPTAEQFLADKAEASLRELNLQGNFKEQVVEGLKWGLPLAGWLLLSTQTVAFIPFILHRIVPHVLRYAAPHVGNAAFWLALATKAENTIKESSENAACGGQRMASQLETTYKSLFYVDSIDELRIKNFKTLSEPEQLFLFETAEKLEAKQLQKASTQDERIVYTLKVLDKQKWSELFVAKPTTIEEFFALPTESQENILFITSQSDAYKALYDNDAERIARMFSSLPNKEKGQIKCATAADFNKLTFSDQERVRVIIATHSHHFQNMVFSSLVEKVEWECAMQYKQPVTWGYGAYRELEHTTRHKLANVLAVYNTLSPEERSELTPSDLRRMSRAKIDHIVSIIETYHPDYIEEMKKAYRLDITRINITSHPLEKERLILAITSLYNKLPAGQKTQILDFTSDEIREMTSNKKQELYLRLQVTEEAALLGALNQLSREEKAAYRSAADLSLKQTEEAKVAINKEITQIKARLKACEVRCAKLSDKDYLAYSYKLQATKREVLNLKDDIQAKSQVRDSLVEAIERLQDTQRKEKLYNLQKEITVKNDKLKVLEKVQQESNAKIELVTQKIAALKALGESLKIKLTNLEQLAGSVTEQNSVPQEATQVTDQINFAIQQTVERVSSQLLNTLFQEAKDGESLKLANQFLDQAKERTLNEIESLQMKITSLKSASNSTPQEQIETELKLRAYVNYDLRLLEGRMAMLRIVKQQFDTPIAAPAA